MGLWNKRISGKGARKNRVLSSANVYNAGQFSRNVKCILSTVLVAIFMLNMVPYAGAALLERNGTSLQGVASDSEGVGDIVNDVEWPTGNWSDHTETDWYTNDPHADSYDIDSPEKLAGLARLVNEGNSFSNKTINITGTIDLSDHLWTPIGTSDSSSNKSFKGTFDGGNHEIRGLYINKKSDYQGLLGYVEGGQIRNVHIASGVVSGKETAGGIVGHTTEKVTITGCTNEAAVTGNGYVGGVVGDAKGGVANCTNTGKLSGKAFVGGVAGCVITSITGCSNSGTVSCEGDSEGIVGGVVGIAGGSIAKCTNEAEVTGTNYVGGMVGYALGSITDCSNKGKVSGTEAVGGVAGYTGDSVTGCTNKAAVTGDGYVGGVVGTAQADSSITGCTNNETVSGRTQVGGLVGETGAGTSVTGCTNTGKVIGKGIVGGVVGNAKENATVTGCTNSGKVVGEGLFGGVVGTAQDDSSITNCTNRGEVINDKSDEESDTGCIGGVAGAARGSVTNCTNEAKVTGTGLSTVGGVVGQACGDASVKGCTNLGTITGLSTVGGVIGGADYENSDPSVTGCINEGEVSGGNFVGGVSGSGCNITGCSNTGAVRGEDYVSGIAGSARNSITGCVNAATITGTGESVGGVAGSALDNSSITDCYYTGCTVGIGNRKDATGIVQPFAKLALTDSNIKVGQTTSVNLTEDNTAAANNALKNKLGPDFKVELTDYNSSNSSVAGVDPSGVVEGIAGGTTEITKRIKIKQNVYLDSDWSTETKIITTSTVPVSVKVERLTPTASDFSFTKPENLEYDGKPKTAKVAAKVDGMGEITTIEYRKGDSGDWTTDQPVELGEYTVRVGVAEGTKYTSAAEIQSDDWKFTIVQASPTPSPKPGPTPTPEKKEGAISRTNDPMSYAVLIGIALVAVVSGGVVLVVRKKKLDK